MLPDLMTKSLGVWLLVFKSSPRSSYLIIATLNNVPSVIVERHVVPTWPIRCGHSDLGVNDKCNVFLTTRSSLHKTTSK